MKDFQVKITTKLDKILTADQMQEFKDTRPGFGPGSGRPRPGQVIPASVEAKLKLGDDQKKEIASLQNEADQKLEKLLTGDQRKQLKDFAAKGPGGFFPGGGPPGGGPPGGSSLFRAYRYALNYPAFSGRTLTAGKTVEEMQPKEQKKKESKGS